MSIRRRNLLLGLGGALCAAGVGGVVAWRRYGFLSVRDAPVGGAVRDYRVASNPAQLPDFVIAKNDTDPTVLTERALDALGSLSRFVSSGDVVLIKPNVGWERTPMQAANTHPEVVAAIVRAALRAGARRVVVTDRPCNDPQASFERSGIGKAASDAGAEVLIPGDQHFREVAVGGQVLDSWPLLEAVLTADKLINVPIAKHHSLSKFTGALKNWFGVVGNERFRLHGHINESIADLAALLRPTLTIVDATRVLLRNGPKGGNLGDVRQTNTVVASIDPVAADAFACTLLDQSPDKLDYLRIAQQRGAGVMDWRSLKLREV